MRAAVGKIRMNCLADARAVTTACRVLGVVCRIARAVAQFLFVCGRRRQRAPPKMIYAALRTDL